MAERLCQARCSPPCAVSYLFPKAHLQLPPSAMVCIMGLCSWAYPGLGSQCLRREANGRVAAYPTCLIGNLTPGRETFSICQIDFPFWFQSEDKPGPAVSGPPGCPSALIGFLTFPLATRVLSLIRAVPFPHSG